MPHVNLLVLSLLLMLLTEVQANETVPDHVRTVEQFIHSFNAKNSHAMARFVADDIEWLNVDGVKVSVEVKGKDDLIASMNAYFKSCSTCRSKLSRIVSTKNRVSAVEVASWQGSDGLKSQQALSVYEFSNRKIIRVYYFSAEN